jgi:hypothetical protein
VTPNQEWRLDPTELALKASAWRRGRLPRAFCAEVGRRLLLAELEFSEWVLRRVEKVAFERDRTVSRRISIEFSIRDDAPVFVDRDGQRYWLVPLSMMRRQTLVNLDLRDEHGESITMPGIRFTQQLDQSILLAAAATVLGVMQRPAHHQVGILHFIQVFIAGDRRRVTKMMNCFEGKDGPTPEYLKALASSPLFKAVLHRLRRSFTLYVLLPVNEGRHRMLRMSFDEPTDWDYVRPDLSDSSDDNGDRVMLYRVDRENLTRPDRRSRLAASFGLSATRIRFQIPAAENATSYHFEMSAPLGLRIVKATLLAGRPNNPTRHVSLDGVVEASPRVGLHAVEVPNGSLCRAQVDLRIPTHGWLATMVICCWLILGVLLSVTVHLIGRAWLADSQVTNIFLLLVTVTAAVITLIVQSDFDDAAERMTTRIRLLAAVTACLPIFTAGFLAYPGKTPSDTLRQVNKGFIFGLTGIAFLIAALMSASWLRAWGDEHPAKQYLRRMRRWWPARRRRARDVGEPHTLALRVSPWDFTEDGPPDVPPVDYCKALTNYGFRTAAIGIRSAEAWHERYAWLDGHQKEAVQALSRPAMQTNRTDQALHCGNYPTACAKCFILAEPKH